MTDNRQDASQAQGEVDQFAVARLSEMADHGRIDAAYGNFSHPALTMIADVRKLLAALPTTPAQPLDAATVERCAQVADADAEKYRGVVHRTNGDDDMASHACVVAARIAVAIRNLATEPHQHGAGNGSGA